MKTTILFDYRTSVNYAVKLFEAVEKNDLKYKLDKRAEALMILIGIDTALRISDLLELKHKDLQITSEYGRPIFHTYIKKTKKTLSIPISMQTLRYYEIFRDWTKLCYGESENIFHNFNTKRVYTRQWAHKRLCEANKKGLLGDKVDVAGAHSLRKTGANRVYEITKDIRDAQYLLGHKNIMQTETYLAVDKKKALERLCNLVY